MKTDDKSLMDVIFQTDFGGSTHQIMLISGDQNFVIPLKGNKTYTVPTATSLNKEGLVELRNFIDYALERDE